MATPAKPRQSGIPGPGRISSIPTPGRTRSSSNVHQTTQITEDVSRAFADAIKANDPSTHRNISLAQSTSTSSLSPQAVAYSGRRSVAGRPTSAASTSSKFQERAKTPSSTRMTSRPSSRSDVHKARDFEVGDNVRIESLGFEGTLKFLGEIKGKPGIWAGVELSGGFSGKGKNNGCVDGKEYFQCPEKCGVFVATTKLSLPTVGPGAVLRPSSVASTKGTHNMAPTNSRHSGRATPSLILGSRTPSGSFSGGRITPSAGGRVTPSNSTGRITPSILVGNAQYRPLKTPMSKTNGQSLSDKITAGSRASKYMTMTAQQLSTRNPNPPHDNLTRQSVADIAPVRVSPSIPGSLSSPSRLSGSPFTTPRAAGRPSAAGERSPTLPTNRGRVSMNTPRARVPSGVAMPPPPSPKVVQSNHFEANMDNTASPSSHGKSLFEEKISPFLSSRPNSSTSFSSAGTDEVGLIEQLQSRLNAAEYENDRLRAAGDANAEISMSRQLEKIKRELEDATDYGTVMEGKLFAANGLLDEKSNELQSFQKENEYLKQQLADMTCRASQDGAAQESEIHARTLEVKSLKDKISELEQVIKSKDEINFTQSSSIQDLSANLEKAFSDFQDERKELFVQIEELRMAGQETIALYEERLSAADGQRYELEHRLMTAETNLKSLTTDPTLRESPSSVNSATMIDNETLREQVQYLQRKSAKLEEQLEETRATLERDISAYQEKISRMRMEEEQHKRDLNFKTREVEQLVQSESGVRSRIEEIEEAFRESAVALEITRAEVEALRTEMANLDVLIDDASEADMLSKLANFIRKVAADKAKYQETISQLEQGLLQSRAENDLLTEQMLTRAEKTSDMSQQAIDLLNAANESLRNQVADLEDKVSTLTRELDSRMFEVDTTRKKANRDAPLLNGTSDVFNTNTGKYETTEELAGLKHIVQELQKENLVSSQQIKLVESENRLLSTEAEQLRQEVLILKGYADRVERRSVESDSNLSFTDERTKYETDVDQMRKQLTETEMKHARMIHDLNKEISELETLVEAKIYREDELEQEIEKLKEKLSRQKKTSKSHSESTEGRQRLSIASNNTGGTTERRTNEEDVCEICERPGHDIFNCSLLKDDKKGVVCEDCETPGHIAADCPHSLDVF